MQIIEQLVSVSRQTQRPGYRLTPEYITIHATGNPGSTAKNEADNVCFNSKRQASFHYVVGEDEIYRIIPDNEVTWNAGDGLNGTGNRKSISIELVETGDRKKVLLNAIDLVKMLMKKYNIPVNKVVQHNFWKSTQYPHGKDCPRILRDFNLIKGGMDWVWFIKKIKGEEEVTETNIKIGTKEIKGLLIDGVTYAPIREVIETIVEELKVTWDIKSGTKVQL